MQIEKSGWTGRAKVVLSLSAVIVFCLTIVQCNSQMDDSAEPQVLEEVVAASDLIDLSGLPVIPKNAFTNTDIRIPEGGILQIADGKIMINGKTVELDEVASLLDGTPPQTAFGLSIEAGQSMGLVRKIQWEIRKANVRKVVYMGQSENGSSVNLMILLPPLPRPGIMIYDAKYIRDNNIPHLPIPLSENTGTDLQEKVYAYVQEHVKAQKEDYIVSFHYNDNDTYSEYLVNLHKIVGAFNRIYEERAQAMYGKGWFELEKERFDNPEIKKMWDAVRQGVPRNISISEN